jgi:hypothetical protein
MPLKPVVSIAQIKRAFSVSYAWLDHVCLCVCDVLCITTPKYVLYMEDAMLYQASKEPLSMEDLV